ncbi:DUF4174 domain-containing protein [Alphaproteobacteria bacterium KMM 3653]|uniref:DUF4174 domain-containing protein n=1 Tax=Harenicola maris TaxID=2841044 RepID=A0AAP2G678_9RHOB|nr:DUF4174 domain-containing protein [Harenicola maris]
MKTVLALTLALIASPLTAQEAAPAAQIPPPPPPQTGVEVIDAALIPDLGDLIWSKRLVVVFADRPTDPRFRQQMELLLDEPAELARRDVLVITDTDPAAKSAARTALRPRDFSLVLVGKDGRVALRKPAPWHVRELTRSIDKMPLRIEEIKNGG